MPHLLVRHKVQNFAAWKQAYDQHAPVRAAAGLRELFLLRALADANEIVLLFQADDLAKAHAFITAPQLGEVMKNAGVLGVPELVELE